MTKLAVPDSAGPSQPELLFPSGPEMTETEEAVWAVVQARRGRSKAIQVKALAKILDRSERKVRAAVANLIKVHGVAIGSAVEPPEGYYVITDPQELEDVYQSLLHRAMAVLVRAASIKNASLEEVFGQIRIGMGGS